MAAKARPSLTSLGDRLAKKPGTPPPPAPAVAPAERTGTKDTRVQIAARITTDERKALRRIALEQDTTVQALVEQAIRDLLNRHGS